MDSPAHSEQWGDLQENSLTYHPSAYYGGYLPDHRPTTKAILRDGLCILLSVGAKRSYISPMPPPSKCSSLLFSFHSKFCGDASAAPG